MIYTFCGSFASPGLNWIAFQLPQTSRVGPIPSPKILWSVPIQSLPNNLQLFSDGMRYLGDGRVLIVGTNELDWENQWLKSLQMYF